MKLLTNTIRFAMFNKSWTIKAFSLISAVIFGSLIFLTFNKNSPVFNMNLQELVKTIDKNETAIVKKESPPKLDVINNSGATKFLTQYETLFANKSEKLSVQADPNKPETITKWWQAAAMIDWYINTPLRYNCKNKKAMGNWAICQDEPYTIKPPCLVYSFGINWDFSFDDDMVKHGCEVYSFDPSMGWKDHKRVNGSMFYNMGLGSANTDGYVAKLNSYVKGRQVWKVRTVKAIMKMLGHEHRMIDVFKMDVESFEWGVLDNMLETDVFKHIRQFSLEYHLFDDFPLKEEYVYLYKTATELREIGMREYAIGPHPKTLDYKKFNNQGDTQYINAYFNKDLISR